MTLDLSNENIPKHHEGNDDDEDQESEMERLIALQQEEEEEELNNGDNTHDEINVLNQHHDENPPGAAAVEEAPFQNNHGSRISSTKSYIRLNYTPLSSLLAILHILYILRTRKQVYLALLYLTSSKTSYILIGNCILSLLVSSFHLFIHVFLNGLRLMESETIMENVRWSATEMCFSLTMFRQQLNVSVVVYFIIIIFLKCLHWAAELRGRHLRMTEEALYYPQEEDEGRNHHPPTNNENIQHDVKVKWVCKVLGKFLPKIFRDRIYQYYCAWPKIRKTHLNFIYLVQLLYCCDIAFLAFFANNILENGPSVHILFAFESAILLVSILNTNWLYTLHFVDSVINLLQKLILETPFHSANGENSDVTSSETSLTNNNIESEGVHSDEHSTSRHPHNPTLTQRLVHQIAATWRDHRATSTFAVELISVAANFLFNIVLFVIMFTVYGLPINIIRDVYISFQNLRRRLSAFASYRHLTSNMNTRFKTVETEEELNEVGRVCIICRDTMEIHGVNGGCKKLPICGHAYHKHCLREWLVQQQTCPTCRADIKVNEARARSEERRRQQTEQEEEKKEETNYVSIQESTSRQEGTGGQNVSPRGDDNSNISNKSENVDTIQKTLSSTNGPSDYFPCLCRVVPLSGTNVLDFKLSSNSSCNNVGHEENEQTTIRHLSKSSLVVCTEKRLWKWTTKSKVGSNLSLEEGKSTNQDYFLRIPDGWILEQDLEVSVKLK